MSVSGGAFVAGGNVGRSHRYLGENRVYYPPPLRNSREEQEHEEEQKSTLSENRLCSSSDCSVSSSGTTCDVSNLCRFLEHTTPHVPAQYFRRIKRWKTMERELHAYFVLGDLWESIKEWSAYGAGVPLVLDGSECVTQYYNVSLSAIQLYVHPSKTSPLLRKPSQESDSESSRETSRYRSNGYSHEKGAKGVHGTWNQPNSSDASNHSSKRVPLRSKPSTSSSSDETESCKPHGQLIFEYFEHEIPYNREPLADKPIYRSNGYSHEKGAKGVHGTWNQPNSSDASNHSSKRVPLRSKPSTSSSSDETESCKPHGQLIFEYFEHEIPYNREPLADKIADLARQFPELKTYRSCDLSPASWVSLAWHPIYRIPTGPTLESMSACFLTFHSLSTALRSLNNDGFHLCSRGRNLSSKLSLPIFGLAFHKLKASVWDPDEVSEGQKADSLLRAADNWIRLLQVNHPDYNYFISHYPFWR